MNNDSSYYLENNISCYLLGNSRKDEPTKTEKKLKVSCRKDNYHYRGSYLKLEISSNTNNNCCTVIVIDKHLLVVVKSAMNNCRGNVEVIGKIKNFNKAPSSHEEQKDVFVVDDLFVMGTELSSFVMIHYKDDFLALVKGQDLLVAIENVTRT